MRKLLSTTAIVLAITTPAFANDTSPMPKTGTEVEASSQLDGAATTPNNSDDKEISSQAAAPEVQVKQDAEEAELSKAAAEEHKENVMDGGEPTKAADEDTTEVTVLGKDTSATNESKSADSKFVESGVTGQFRASNLIGMRIYATERDIDASATAEANGRTDWDDIGEINDIIVSTDGDVTAVILGIGGFLGIGEKDVAVNMDQLRVVREKDDSDDYFLVVQASRSELESAPAYKRVSVLD